MPFHADGSATRVALRLAGLACLLLLAQPKAALAQEVKPPVNIAAEVVEGDINLSEATATGHAVLTYGAITLQADTITASRSTGEVMASGHLVLRQAERTLTGDHFQGNMNSNTGFLTHAQVVEQGVVVHGDRIEFSPALVTASNAYFTTCPNTPPHFRIEAERLTLTAAQPKSAGTAAPTGAPPTGGRLALTHARIYFHNRRVITLPSYSVSVGQIQQRKASLVPTTGFSRADGAYTSVGRSFSKPGGKRQVDLNLHLTTNRGLRGVFEVREKRGPAEVFFDYTRRQDVGEEPLEGDVITQNTEKVLVNREPELGAQVATLPFRHGLTLTAQVSAGRYSEQDSETRATLARANRVSATAIVASAPRLVRPHLTWSHALGVRQTVYSPGDALTVGYLRLTTDLSRSDIEGVSLSYVRRVSAGSSPFVFDRVDLADEMRLDVRHRLNAAWRFQLIDRYDLERRTVKDMEVSLTRTAHCLEYTAGWRKLRGSFFIGIGLAPMPAGEAVAPAEP